MFLRTKLSLAGLAVSLSGGVALAQQTQPSVQNPGAGIQARRAVMRRRAMAGMFRVLNQLDLTVDQKQQARSIIQTNLQGTKTQRQEMRQLTQQWRQGTLTPEGLTRANELHKQLAETRKALRAQLAGILTPEQKAKLEEMIKTRRANHGLFERQGPRPN
jgi:Spy/CpxP family protein refolding chaperone